MALSVQRSAAAIRGACVDEDWLNAAGTSEKAKKMLKSVLDTDFWRRLRDFITLVQPFSDLIHQLESDRAMLSQVRLVRV
jgi:hypothetical protein